MKKLKLILPVLLAAVMLLTIPFSVACKKKGSKPDTLQSISLDLTYVKQEYFVGENFSADGLVVTASILRAKAKTPENVELESSDYVIDWSAYSKSVVGEYPIVVSYTFGDVTKSETYNVSVKNQVLVLDTTKVKKLYVIGEDSSTDPSGLVATLITYEPGKEPVSQNVTSSVYVAWNRVDLTKENTYTVEVRYYGTKTVISSFEVEVIQPRNGLQVSLLDGVVLGATVADNKLSASIELTAANNSISIDTSKIEVRKSDKYGVLIDEVITLDSNYTVKVYKEQTEITNLTNLHGGIYQIWVSTQSQDSDGKPYEVAGFAPIYVADTLSSIAFKSGLTTQEVGKDEISDTWIFTATYVSGAEEDLTVAEIKASGGTVSLDTTIAGDKSATVKFNSVSATGVKTTKSTTVSYTITPLIGEHDYIVTFTPNNTDKRVDIKWGELVGSTQHCSYNGSVDNYSSSEKSTIDGEVTYSNYVQIKSNKTMTITLGNAVKANSVTITVYVSHNNSGGTRTANIKTGNGVVASEVITSAGTAEPLHVLKAESQSAGSYTIDATDTMYVYAVVVTYTVDYGSGS